MPIKGYRGVDRDKGYEPIEDYSQKFKKIKVAKRGVRVHTRGKKILGEAKEKQRRDFEKKLLEGHKARLDAAHKELRGIKTELKNRDALVKNLGDRLDEIFPDKKSPAYSKPQMIWTRKLHESIEKKLPKHVRSQVRQSTASSRISQSKKLGPKTKAALLAILGVSTVGGGYGAYKHRKSRGEEKPSWTKHSSYTPPLIKKSSIYWAQALDNTSPDHIKHYAKHLTPDESGARQEAVSTVSQVTKSKAHTFSKGDFKLKSNGKRFVLEIPTHQRDQADRKSPIIFSDHHTPTSTNSKDMLGDIKNFASDIGRTIDIGSDDIHEAFTDVNKKIKRRRRNKFVATGLGISAAAGLSYAAYKKLKKPSTKNK